MKFLLSIIFLATLNLSQLSLAEGDGDGHQHSDTICSATNTDICLHLGFPKKANSTDEAKFMVHFLVSAEKASLLNVDSVVLWMDEMGHGSSPTTLNKVGEGKYFVSNAWFIMTGVWSVKVNYTINGQTDTIVVPVTIDE